MMPSAGFRRTRILASLYAIVLAVYVVASPIFSAAAFQSSGWRGENGALVPAAIALLPGYAISAASGVGPGGREHAGRVYVAFVAVMTLVWLAGLAMTWRSRDSIDDQTVESVFRWSITFTVIAAFATPVLVQDFWLSVGWGRAVAEGVNPYYSAMPRPDELPLGDSPGLMTYGPLWALIAGLTAAAAGGSSVLTAVAQKLVLTAGWIGVLFVTRTLIRDREPASRAATLLLVGWAPLCLLHAVADGHNDAVLAFLMMLSLLWLERGAAFRSGLALGASIAVKYVTAPLLLLLVVRGIVERRGAPGKWFFACVVATGIAVSCLAIFYRSPAFFVPLDEMKDWHFLTPSALLLDFLEPKGVPRALARLIDLAVIVGAGSAALMALRHDSVAGLRSAALWIMSGVLAGATGHVWPWFLLWVVGPAAIQLAKPLGMFVAGMVAAAPFVLLPWRMQPALEALYRLTLPGIALYASGFAALFVGRAASGYLRKTVSTPSPGA